MGEQEYLPRSEFNQFQEKIMNALEEVRKQLTEIAHNIQVNALQTQDIYDTRYVKKAELYTLASSLLDDPSFVGRCSVTTVSYLNSSDGVEKISNMIDRHMACKRDSTVKWLEFLKWIGAIAIIVSLYTGGNNIVKSNAKTQQHIIEQLENIGR